MKRITLAAAALLGATVVAGMLSVALFGCCALPFHRTLHRMMPSCSGILRALHHGSHDEAAPARPAPSTRAGKALAAQALAGVAARRNRVATTAATPRSLRDLVTLGALRCDDDVGLHLLLATLLI